MPYLLVVIMLSGNPYDSHKDRTIEKISGIQICNNLAAEIRTMPGVESAYCLPIDVRGGR